MNILCILGYTHALTVIMIAICILLEIKLNFLSQYVNGPLWRIYAHRTHAVNDKPQKRPQKYYIEIRKEKRKILFVECHIRFQFLIVTNHFKIAHKK